MDINKEERAEVIEAYVCPNCGEYFKPAPRCPNCGQLIANGYSKLETVRAALQAWSEGKEVRGIKAPTRGQLFFNLEWAIHTLATYGKYRTVCLDELEYWRFFGFNIQEEGIGWVIS